jgi:hypothetical protein
MSQTTRDEALDLVDEAKSMAAMHPEFVWAQMMLDQAMMIEKLVSQLDDGVLA